QKIYARMLTYYVYIAVLYALGMAVFAKDIIAFVAAPAFHQAHVVVPAVLMAYAFYGMYNLLQIGVHLKRQTKYVPLFTAVGAAVNLGANLVLIPRYGMMGAACAGFSGFLAMAIFTCALSRRLYPIPYEFARLAKILGVAAALYLVGTQLPVHVGWPQLLWKAAMVASYPAALYLTRFYAKEEIERAARAIGWTAPRLPHGVEPSRAV
ncbi:MAG: hypothetical protein FJ272_03810, partial [Planctomycetes bacterium]|nr:hypothetical protein [Planctomycetota bacterium]